LVYSVVPCRPTKPDLVFLCNLNKTTFLAKPNLALVHKICREIHEKGAIKSLTPAIVGKLSEARGGPHENTVTGCLTGKPYKEIIYSWLHFSVPILNSVDDRTEPGRILKRILNQVDSRAHPGLLIVDQICREFYEKEDIEGLSPKNIGLVSKKRGGPTSTTLNNKYYRELIGSWIDLSLVRLIESSKKPDLMLQSLVKGGRADLKISLCIVHQLCREYLERNPGSRITIGKIAKLSEIVVGQLS